MAIAVGLWFDGTGSASPVECRWQDEAGRPGHGETEILDLFGVVGLGFFALCSDQANHQDGPGCRDLGVRLRCARAGVRWCYVWRRRLAFARVDCHRPEGYSYGALVARGLYLRSASVVFTDKPVQPLGTRSIAAERYGAVGYHRLPRNDKDSTT